MKEIDYYKITKDGKLYAHVAEWEGKDACLLMDSEKTTEHIEWLQRAFYNLGYDVAIKKAVVDGLYKYNTVKERRETMGLSVLELARMMNLNPTIVYRIEDPNMKNSGKSLVPFAQFFGCTVEELVAADSSEFLDSCTKPKMKYYATNIKERRKKIGISPYDLGYAVGYNDSVVRNAENPSICKGSKALLKFSDFFGCPIEELAGDSIPETQNNIEVEKENNIAERRRELGFSQLDLARTMGIPVVAINLIENPAYHFTYGCFKRYADFFKCSIEELFY